MQSYENALCPVCSGRLFEDDDIVVCPICGTPHHRDCYTASGHCANESKHNEGFVWQPPAPSSDEGENPPPYSGAGAIHICRQCGQTSRGDFLFCPHCGMPFMNGNSVGNAGGQFSGFVHLDPLGGVAPNESIDGVPAEKIAKFVRVGTGRYLPVFRNQSVQKKKAGWNWAAFITMFFQLPAWFFYRKQYKMGMLAAAGNILSAVLAAPLTAMLYTLLPNNAGYAQIFQLMTDHMPQLLGLPMLLMTVGGILRITFAVLAGMFGDSLYRRHTVSSLKSIAQRGEDEDAAIFKKGGVNIWLPLLTAVGMDILSSFMILWLM